MQDEIWHRGSSSKWMGYEQSSAGTTHRAWGVQGGYQGRRELKTVPCIIVFSDYFL